MGKAKEIILKAITAKSGNDFIRMNHYSRKVVPNSQVHIGVFLNNRLGGVLQFGPCINKKGTINLVEGTGWNEFIELNRMVFTDLLPRNSESRAIAIAMKLIKKHASHVKWVVSFADATQCGDGTIYRASGFVLTSIAKNTALRINPVTGEPMHIIQAHHKKVTSKTFRSWLGLKGFQLRYLYFIDKSCREKLTVPEIPFSKIAEMGATMYKGQSAVLA
jgi:hypothetical protein